jgi:hypothetical protein
MGIYRSYSCPRCGNTLFQLIPWGAKGVAEPIRKCSKCAVVVDVRSLCTEWDLMSESEQLSMRRHVTWTAAQIGGLWGALPPLIFASWIFEQLGVTGTTFSELGPPWLGMGLVGGTVGFLIHRNILRKQLNHSIASSQRRMQDRNYVAKLAAAGIMDHARR